MDYLALLNRFASEADLSTTFSATTGLTGQDLRAAQWVNQAYTEIQESKSAWNWRKAEATGVETIAIGDTSVTLLGASANFEKLLPYDPTGHPFVLFYQNAVGVTDAQECYLLPYHEFNGYYDSGRFNNSSGRPQFCTITPTGTLRFFPKADVAYKIKYAHTTTLQTLSATSDTPVMPTRYHMLIVYLALTYYGASNEVNRIVQRLGVGLNDPDAPKGSPLRTMYRDLCRDQLQGMSYFGES